MKVSAFKSLTQPGPLNVSGKAERNKLSILKMELRKANFSEITTIWEILQQAIEQRRQDGSEQWQNGYPSQQTVFDDITNGYGYVITDNNVVIAYAAIIFGVEPAIMK